jgi:hypothetical protein
MNGGRSFNTHRIVCIYSFAVNPVRNSSGALNPALRGGTPYGAEPGIILKSNPAAASGSEREPPSGA